MNKYYVIWDRRSAAWWGPGGRGYTTNLLECGAFTEGDLKRLNHEEHRDDIQPLDQVIDRMAFVGTDRRVIDVFKTRKHQGT